MCVERRSSHLSQPLYAMWRQPQPWFLPRVSPKNLLNTKSLPNRAITTIRVIACLARAPNNPQSTIRNGTQQPGALRRGGLGNDREGKLAPLSALPRLGRSVE